MTMYQVSDYNNSSTTLFFLLISLAEYYFSSPHYQVDEGVGVDTQITLTVKRTGVLVERTIGKICLRWGSGVEEG